METVRINMEVKSADVELLKIYETIDQFQSAVDDIIEEIKKRNS
ncbi:MAG: hypothetical protein Q7K55_06960 [Candidatus Levybacteria bacterium]|nr:hypothetical protein [Candidatus Levybacteria bacterium]